MSELLSPLPSWAPAGLLVLCVLLFSSKALASPPLMGPSLPCRETVREFYGHSLSPEDAAGGVPEGVDVVAWVSYSREWPEWAHDEAFVREIRSFVEDGGSLLLFAHAVSYVRALGLETGIPGAARMRAYSRGNGYRRAHFGFQPTASHPLFEGLAPTAENVYFVCGTDSGTVQHVGWNPGELERGRVLGKYIEFVEDGYRPPEEPLVFGEPEVPIETATVVEWTLGKGRVLGWGMTPTLEPRMYNTHQANLEVFLRSAAEYLGGEGATVAVLPPTRAQLGLDPAPSAPEKPAPQPHAFHQAGPNLPYIGNWGWHGQVSYQRQQKEDIDPSYFREHIIAESFRRGANLLEIYPTAMPHSFPYTWAEDDPVPRGETYKEYVYPEEGDRLWDWETFRKVIAWARERDFIVHTFYHGRPAEDPEELFDFAELQARELQNPLLYGAERAQDGVGVESWLRDEQRLTYARSWMYNPGSYFHTTSAMPARSPMLSASLMCAWGRVAGLYASGFSNEWRYGSHPPLYISYQADCREERPSHRIWGGWSTFGGGSYPDWVARQIHDFARDRLMLGSAIWWLGEPASTLNPEHRTYVYALSADPLRAAAAFRLRATGLEGYRERMKDAFGAAPDAWAATEDAPQDAAVLQNNMLRVLRMADQDAGVFEYDPKRLASFQHVVDEERPVQLARNFLHLIEEPNAAEAVEVLRVGQDDGLRGAGGYETRHVWDGEGAASFPAAVGYESEPEWPTELVIPVELTAGRYRLRIVAQSTDTLSTLRAHLDDDLIGFFMYGEGGEEPSVAFSVASPGRHEIRLEAERAPEGGIRFQEIVLERIAERAATHQETRMAGHEARLVETVVLDASGEGRQVRTYTARSDWPVLAVRVENPDGGEWKRDSRIAFDAHEAPQRVDGMENAWRFAGRTAETPAIGVVLLDAEGASLEAEADALRLAFEEGAGTFAALAFILEEGLYTEDDYADAARLVKAGPLAMELTPETPREIPSRIGAAAVDLVQVLNPAGEPYMAAETDAQGERWWTVRGAQPIRDGEADLLKVYTAPGSDAKVQPYGFIDGVVKPGWGCQNVLGILDAPTPTRCEVKVVKTGPFIFAPRVEWKTAFSSVRVNGEPWRYFEGRSVMLPNRPGRYVIEIEPGEEANAPHLARTAMSVQRAQWLPEARVLEFELDEPHWWAAPEAPGTQPYAAMIRSAEPPVRVEGAAELIPWEDYRASAEDVAAMKEKGFMLRVRRGEVRVHFGQ